MSLEPGPVMLDIAGVELDAEDREILRHPAVGGVILFARNYADPAQLRALTGSIAALREPPLLIAVDQEGGRVQRFRTGFTRLPPVSAFGQLHDRQPAAARRAAADIGWLMAAELLAAGVDFSFAPVLDVERGISRVIGDRAFSSSPEVVAELAAAWVGGVHAAGMAACGKHFPGHGAVEADSHLQLPVDDRPLAALEGCDLLPFSRLIRCGLEALMPAHVVYRRIDPRCAGFSPFWLRQVLRGRLGFDGMIFSDDLNMAAAAAGGGFAERARAALEAGCDMAVVCNNRPGAAEVVTALSERHQNPRLAARVARMRARSSPGADDGARRSAALAVLDRLQST
ncbi:MAG: beta-N-acetylhexosaminidase [Thiohalocapsa sp.]|nr:beta-N-acetylhexosaminidase [Thiohalocapsa sp.]